MGEAREVRGWNKEGNLLLADGSCYTFETLIEKAHLPLNRKLLAVASLRGLVDAWLLNAKCLDAWLTEQSKNEPFSTQPAKAVSMWDVGVFLEDHLRQFGVLNPESENIEAVAWFQDEGSAVGWDKPVLLRSFREITPEASQQETLEPAKELESPTVNETIIWHVQQQIEKELDHELKAMPSASHVFLAYCRDRLTLVKIVKKNPKWKLRTVRARKAALKAFIRKKLPGLTLESFFVDRSVFEAAERQLKELEGQTH
ncbi:MAG: hypothetical protein AAB676_14855 [Verrucomicrobiota bacterium]